MYLHVTRTSHIHARYSLVLSHGAHFFIRLYLACPLISWAAKSGDRHFYPYSRSGVPSDFSENTSILLQNATKLSANGPMKPQKCCQRDEDFNFGIEKFPSATLEKFLPHEHKRHYVGTKDNGPRKSCFCCSIKLPKTKGNSSEF